MKLRTKAALNIEVSFPHTRKRLEETELFIRMPLLFRHSKAHMRLFLCSKNCYFIPWAVLKEFSLFFSFGRNIIKNDSGEICRTVGVHHLDRSVGMMTQKCHAKGYRLPSKPKFRMLRMILLYG